MYTHNTNNFSRRIFYENFVFLHRYLVYGLTVYNLGITLYDTFRSMILKYA